MQISYSKISTHKKCPFQFKLRYIDQLETLPKGDPQDPLIIGTALHTAIEKDVQTAIDEYYASYSVITDLHVNEAIKLEYWLPKIKEVLPEGLHEVKIEDEDFKGFIDLLVPANLSLEERDDICVNCDKYECGYQESGRCPFGKYEIYDLYDFKYSNNIKGYKDSEQLHLYKYYFEKLNPGKCIRNMYFMFVPKTNIKIKYKNKTNPRDETIAEFRKRIISTLEKNEIQFIKIDYDPTKVIDFLTNAKHAIEDDTFEKNPTRLCDWCEYQAYCEKGDMTMILPKNERSDKKGITKKKIWIYGMPFSGKTYLANEFPDLLLLSTDGNYTQLPGGIPPHIDIKNIVTTEGRMTKTQLAWDVFKETIAELEKKQNDFKTIVVDLVEDTYEACRLYMYDKLGITHESDDSFRAWDKVRTEFLSTMRRLFSLDYDNIILISHEDTSKDITKKSGDKVTSIKPNINDKCANKLAGMVDIVVRTIADGDNYTLSFKKNEVVFGGGRLNVHIDEIQNSYEALMKVYDEANAATTSTRAPEVKPKEQKQESNTNTSDEPETPQNEPEEAPKPRTRKRREEVEEVKETKVEEAQAEEEQPKPRRRRRRTE